MVEIPNRVSKIKVWWESFFFVVQVGVFRGRGPRVALMEQLGCVATCYPKVFCASYLSPILGDVCDFLGS
jgi:hypothetical protein